MPQTYAFQVSMPVTDTLPRNRISNTIHLQHTIGALADTDLKSMCDSIVALWQTKYGVANREIQCKAYDVDAKPNYPRATSIVNVGAFWDTVIPREVCLVLSFAGHNRGNKAERGRLYLQHSIAKPDQSTGLRPTSVSMNWALGWYTTANASLPDLGGVDWQFGVWSRTYQKFTKSEQAWCNDEWDIQRSRGLRETTRVSATREG